ncbi:MAG TPA: DNA-directed RNA polymerase subunit omega [Bacteroidales bacterium]|nr:DNA-directed RNA polymerase subunit omega [Bacteroidales bacterium]HOS57897.1 DNA-directed RNA polymerase subunit omega [Bacteroidales bacterium]HRR04378.1 DNA-directed RNA polymerase subunit omega [Bacteroidales bacterium]HRT13715.1 DNA-directed RNA polymerase subunit omega [Bacteroidales bacterium]HXK74516.1 DNA-directed RNA polymerase subunit omega [Bacteroidales bacterium]
MKADYKNIKAEYEAITRDLSGFDKKTGSIYESVYIISRRANQIATEIKDELTQKIREFSSATDTLDEVFENREQINLAKYYEQIPKPSLLAIKEFEDDKIYFKKYEEESDEL